MTHRRALSPLFRGHGLNGVAARSARCLPLPDACKEECGLTKLHRSCVLSARSSLHLSHSVIRTHSTTRSDPGSYSDAFANITPWPPTQPSRFFYSLTIQQRPHYHPRYIDAPAMYFPLELYIALSPRVLLMNPLRPQSQQPG
jgi:hypothetical protein